MIDRLVRLLDCPFRNGFPNPMSGSLCVSLMVAIMEAVVTSTLAEPVGKEELTIDLFQYPRSRTKKMKGFLCLVLASVLVALVWGAQKREEIVMVPMRDGGKQDSIFFCFKLK